MGRVVAAKREARTDNVRAIELTSAVSSVPHARHVVADDLKHSGLPSSVIENALIVVTELVTNAILHAQPVRSGDVPPAVGLQWTVIDDRIMINVTDGGGPERPRLRQPSSADDDGRGLSIVDAVALEWGVDSEPGRVCVHALVGPWNPTR